MQLKAMEKRIYDTPQVRVLQFPVNGVICESFEPTRSVNSTWDE